MTVGSRLKKLRQKRKVGLRELGEVVGRSPSYLSRVERGLNSMTVDELSGAAAFFGVQPQEFFIDKELVPSDIQRTSEVGIAAIIEYLEDEYPVIVTGIELVRAAKGDTLAHVHINYEEKEA